MRAAAANDRQAAARVQCLHDFHASGFCPVGRVLRARAQGAALGEARAILPPPPGSSIYWVEQAGGRYVFPALRRSEAEAFANQRAACAPADGRPEAFGPEAARLGAIGACEALPPSPWAEAFMRELRPYGILRRAGASPDLSERILADTMGEPWARLVTDPYGLLDGDVSSLREIDAMALAMGHLPSSPERADAWVSAALIGWDAQGRLCGKALGDVCRTLAPYGFEAQAVEAAVRRAADAELCRWDGRRLWGWTGWETDAQVVGHLGRLREGAAKPRARKASQQADKALEALSEGQQKAVDMAHRHPVSILTGGPGVGKTTVIRHMADQSAAAGDVYLCAPTGRAAQRLAEACGRPATTIHRLLHADAKGGFGRDAEHPLPVSDVYVDEASMLDRDLCLRLLAALPDGARLILSGDPGQLPPVGEGNILRDMLDSGGIPAARLTEIFRQKADSGIVQLAARLREGEAPWGLSSPDLAWTELPPPGESTAEDWAATLADDVPRQWFAARHEGPFGVKAVNRAAQAALNPDGASLPIGPDAAPRHRIRAGDRVRQTRNNYKLGVMNGAIGIVKEVREAFGGAAVVAWGGETRTHREEALEDLDLAYAITVHAAQGSEFEHVGVIVPPDAGWSREHLYTAITRAKRSLRVHGSAGAFMEASASVAAPDPTSFLPQLKEALTQRAPKVRAPAPGA